MDWGTKIDIIEKETGKSIYKELNIRPAYISDLRSGKSKNPGSDFVLSIINKFNVNPEWLLNGQGEIFLTKESVAKDIQIQHIKIGIKQKEENSVLFLWAAAPREENLNQILQSFKEKNGNVKTLFMPFFTKDFPEKVTYSKYKKKLMETCNSHNIEFHPFEISDRMLKNTDSISSIKKCMCENIFPRIHALKPSHLWLGLKKSDNETDINITHAMLGLYVLDQYFDKTFPQDSVSLCQIEERFTW